MIYHLIANPPSVKDFQSFTIVKTMDSVLCEYQEASSGKTYEIHLAVLTSDNNRAIYADKYYRVKKIGYWLNFIAFYFEEVEKEGDKIRFVNVRSESITKYLEKEGV